MVYLKAKVSCRGGARRHATRENNYCRVPRPALTAQEVADFLGLSHPFPVKLPEDGGWESPEHTETLPTLRSAPMS